MKIKITADSTADLSKVLCEKYNIELIPLQVALGDENFEDGVSINPDMIYDYVAKNKQLPKTGAINQQGYFEKFKNILDSGYEGIIHFSLSSEMSVTHQNAKLAGEELQNVHVIDSQSLSTGIGIQAIYASELASQNMDIKEIVQKVEERKSKVQAGFVLDKLEYLYRGGRCNAISLLGANLLKIKPCIEVHDGKMGMTGKFMGKFASCVKKYVASTLEKYNNPDTTRIFVTHTKIDQEIVDEVIEYLKQNTQFAEILETTAGSTITSHCGPNTIGILFYNN